MFQILLNPDGLSPDKDTGYYPDDVADRFPDVLQTAVLIYMVVGMLGVLLMVQTKKYRKRETQLSRQALIQSTEHSSGIEVRIGKIKEAFKSRHIYIMWLQFYLCSGFGLMAASQFKQYGLKQIDDDNFFAIVGSIGAISNGLSRFAWAAMLDYFSPDYLIAANSLLLIILSSTWNAIATSKPLFMIWMILIYFQYGGLFTFYPTLASRIFGAKQGPKIYNIVGTSMVFANFTQFAITKTQIKNIGYSGIFYIYTGFGALSLLVHVISLYYKRRPKHRIITN